MACCQGALLAGCSPAAVPSSAGLPTAGAHELIVEGVVAERWIDGHLRLSAAARRGTLDRRAGQVVAEGLVLVSQDPSRVETGRLQAGRAAADLKGDRAELSGEVVLTDRMGRTVTATYAVYLGATHRVEVPGPVRVFGHNFEAHGPSMTVSLSSETATVPGPVRATVITESE